jgi:tRNA nucleotidyltransferase (CCA-adding enzyme)
VLKAIEDYVRALDLDAYLVGGAVRDELRGIDSKDADFLVPGVDVEGLRAALEPHGRVEDLVVADRLVGVRLHPRDATVRALAPAGIEFAPPREEQSTGPGRHDFVIVANPSLSVEDDMRRRDFTVNAMARRLSDGTLVDPCGGRSDLEQRVLRTVSPRSFQEDPLRLVRGLRFVSQLGLDPEDETRRQMREEGPAVRLVSGERLGDEVAKLLLGSEPVKALRLARDTGVLLELLPEFERAIGFDQESRWHDLTVDEHTFLVVQAAADEEMPLRVRLATLLHDLGKPYVAWRGDDGRLHYYAKPGRSDRAHEDVSAELAARALARLRYPNDLRARVLAIVRDHAFQLGKVDPLRARRFLATHGDQLALDLLDHRRADLLGKSPDGPPDEDLARLADFRALVEAERANPYRLGDLAVDGSDLIGLGYVEGPAIGQTLRALLDEVVEAPERNEREWLLERARELR